jgi:hypothetical protein
MVTTEFRDLSSQKAGADSSGFRLVEYEGASLNKELLVGPDLMNSLLGVLMRFRQESVGVMCDVEQMFHSFYVDPAHRDFLRSLWFKDNDPSQEIIEYKMTVHLFGNSPSRGYIRDAKGCKRRRGETRSGREEGWDEPLPDDLNLRWQSWRSELPALENVSVSRCYHPRNFGRVARSEIHAFSDASKDAIATAVYLKQVNEEGEISVSMAFGQSKVAPTQPTRIPRLELCAAVMAKQ